MRSGGSRAERVNLAIDCTGVLAAAAALSAVRCVKTWGTACYVGEGGDVTLDVSPDLLRRQVTLIGSWTFSAMGMLECARFIADNRIDLERIFSHRWRLEQADEAYRTFDTQTTGKGVFLLPLGNGKPAREGKPTLSHRREHHDLAHVHRNAGEREDRRAVRDHDEVAAGALARPPSR